MHLKITKRIIHTVKTMDTGKAILIAWSNVRSIKGKHHRTSVKQNVSTIGANTLVSMIYHKATPAKHIEEPPL